MKKFILSLCVLGGTIGATNAQKIGYINANDLIVAMPEAAKVNKDLQEAGDVLTLQKQELELKVVELDSILTKTDTTKMPKAKLALLKKEFGLKYVEYQQFDQKAQEEMQAKQQEFLAPVQKKAMETVQAVAKDNGYTYVFYKENLVVYPASDDLLPLCKKKLGIVDKPAAAPKAAGAPAPKAGI